MKKILTIWFVILLLLGVIYAANAAQDVVNTKHNLSTSATVSTYYLDPVVVPAQTAEVCVFCHTPHGGSSAVGVALWNRATSDPATFTMYSSSTIDMTIASTGPETVSLACLSCHDGTIAFDSLLNAPGSGDYDPTGTSRGWTFFGGTSLSGSGITEIGLDLSNDHPISVGYDTGADTAFNSIASVEAAGLKFYAGSVSTKQVECASCHDPHEATNPTFLRISNAASALCTTCHDK